MLETATDLLCSIIMLSTALVLYCVGMEDWCSKDNRRKAAVAHLTMAAANAALGVMFILRVASA